MSADPWRIRQVEKRVDELDDYVRGPEPYSIDRRIIVLENERIASQLANEALKAYRKERDRLSTRMREWGSFVIAAAAIVVSILHVH